jgi:hypothetical protein
MFKLYSERIKDAKGEPEVFVYDNFPKEFRNQFFHIIADGFDKFERNYEFRDIWQYVCNSFAREQGLKSIFINNKNSMSRYIDECSNSEFLDLMDYIFTVFIDNSYLRQNFGDDPIDKAITELNYRFKQHNLGYEFTNGEIIPKTNTIAHETIIKPALKLLLDEDFRGAEEEYLKAFDCYKKNDNKNSILEAIKAFESTMKTICDKLDYVYNKEKDTASKLIAILESNNFYPPYLNNHVTGIRVTLESGAPTLRNKKAGHGQGATVVDVSDEYVEYALNLVATNIVLLFKIYKKHKKG